MSASFTIMTLNTGKERSPTAICSMARLYYPWMPIFVDQQVIIAETFAEKHFWQFRLTCINLSSFN
jgi:hypothetical protein